MSDERFTDLIQTVFFSIVAVCFLLACTKACEYEHIEKMEKIKMECKK